MSIVALVIVVPLLALVLAALVRDVRDDGYAHRADRRSTGAGDDQVPFVGIPSPTLR